MKNKKGFTLIELLAVIVILAIIALIATPIILNMIENAKKGAAKDSAYGYIEAIDFQNSMSGIDSEKYKMVGPGEDLDVTTLDVKVKGSKPENGKVTIDSTGRVTKAELCINNYIVTYDGKTAATGTKCGKTEDEVVVKNNTILDKAKTLVYADGTCKTDGTTYEYMGGCYIKGTSTNNYVWYNGFMWRIMGINEDGTVRLITEDNVTSLPYGAEKTAATYVTNEGYIHNWLNTYFLTNLNNTKSIIKEGKYFCSEITTDEFRKNTTCTNGNEVNASVGIISLDEYNLSGALDIGEYFWTMTPYDDYNAWCVNEKHYGTKNYAVESTIIGIRPVINVDSKATITEGDGTTSNYYVLVEDKTNNKTGVIGNIATSGEYVSLEEKIYRVVSKDNDGVKLILDGYYDTNVAYGSNNTFTTTSGIGAILNGEVLNSLNLSNSDKIKETIWYQGNEILDGFKYTDVLNSASNEVKAKVGLIRVGELLASQSSTISSKKTYWTMNKYALPSFVWFVDVELGSHYESVSNIHAIRPVIVVRNDLDIISGNGTPSSPYEI